MNKKLLAFFALTMGSASAMAGCPALGSNNYSALTTALKNSVASIDAVGNPTGGTLQPQFGADTTNGGLDFDMWATVVGTDGTVCWVTKTGDQLDHQWLASRVISAQKAFTALSLSTNDFALSSANLYTAVQPGGSLFGLQAANPVDPAVAYSGNSNYYGLSNDPMIGRKIGGTNVFGGGLALYDSTGKLVGGLGVSGDTSCADHNVAWRLRHLLNLDYVPHGVNHISGHKPDNIVYPGDPDYTGWGHPLCSTASRTVNSSLPY